MSRDRHRHLRDRRVQTQSPERLSHTSSCSTDVSSSNSTLRNPDSVSRSMEPDHAVTDFSCTNTSNNPLRRRLAVTVVAVQAAPSRRRLLPSIRCSAAIFIASRSNCSNNSGTTQETASVMATRPLYLPPQRNSSTPLPLTWQSSCDETTAVTLRHRRRQTTSTISKRCRRPWVGWTTTTITVRRRLPPNGYSCRLWQTQCRLQRHRQLLLGGRVHEEP